MCQKLVLVYTQGSTYNITGCYIIFVYTQGCTFSIMWSIIFLCTQGVACTIRVFQDDIGQTASMYSTQVFVSIFHKICYYGVCYIIIGPMQVWGTTGSSGNTACNYRNLSVTSLPAKVTPQCCSSHYPAWFPTVSYFLNSLHLTLCTLPTCPPYLLGWWVVPTPNCLSPPQTAYPFYQYLFWILTKWNCPSFLMIFSPPPIHPTFPAYSFALHALSVSLSSCTLPCIYTYQTTHPNTWMHYH